jgi:hypothetical protein
MILFIYCDCTNTIDPHTIITIFLIFSLYSILCFPDRFYFLSSILVIDIWFLLFASFAGLLWAHSTYRTRLIFLAYY